jgi:hypothetical protein
MLKKHFPLHAHTRYSNKTMYWYGHDNQTLFDQNLKNPVTRAKLEQHGWIDQQGNAVPLEYKFNSQGFRCDNFDNRPAGIALGCSHTMGIGNHLKDTWPQQLSKMMNFPIWNLGVGGSSLDTAFRMLTHYIDTLNTKFVVMWIPNMHRFEYFDSNVNVINVLAPQVDKELESRFFKSWFGNDQNSDFNHLKNMYAIQWLCSVNGVPLYCLQGSQLYTPTARDLSHYGPDGLEFFATKMHENIQNSGIKL